MYCCRHDRRYCKWPYFAEDDSQLNFGSWWNPSLVHGSVAFFPILRVVSDTVDGNVLHMLMESSSRLFLCRILSNRHSPKSHVLSQFAGSIVLCLCLFFLSHCTVFSCARTQSVLRTSTVRSLLLQKFVISLSVHHVILIVSVPVALHFLLRGMICIRCIQIFVVVEMMCIRCHLSLNFTCDISALSASCVMSICVIRRLIRVIMCLLTSLLMTNLLWTRICIRIPMDHV